MSSVPSVLRPLTCHSPVRPGRTANRGVELGGEHLCLPAQARRGPTSDMSPRSTLNSWGSSSRLVRRRNAPVRVIRRSLFSLELPFSTVSSPRSSRAISRAAPVVAAAEHGAELEHREPAAAAARPGPAGTGRARGPPGGTASGDQQSMRGRRAGRASNEQTTTSTQSAARASATRRCPATRCVRTVDGRCSTTCTRRSRPRPDAVASRTRHRARSAARVNPRRTHQPRPVGRPSRTVRQVAQLPGPPADPRQRAGSRRRACSGTRAASPCSGRRPGPPRTGRARARRRTPRRSPAAATARAGGEVVRAERVGEGPRATRPWRPRAAGPRPAHVPVAARRRPGRPSGVWSQAVHAQLHPEGRQGAQLARPGRAARSG